MLCLHCLKILKFWTRGPHFCFALDPTNYVPLLRWGWHSKVPRSQKLPNALNLVRSYSEPVGAQLTMQFWPRGWREEGISKSYWPELPVMYGLIMREESGSGMAKGRLKEYYQGKKRRMVNSVIQSLLLQVYREGQVPQRITLRVPSNTSTQVTDGSFHSRQLLNDCWLAASTDSRTGETKGNCFTA